MVLVLALAALGGAAGVAVLTGSDADAEEHVAAGGRVLRIAYVEDPDFDPASPGEYEDHDFQRALFEPLVTLDDELRPVPALAERWETSADGLTVTFHLRADGRWTNGDPVTAHDFEWSWKRVLAPETKGARAPQLAGIAGASAYATCERDCAGLRDGVGVRAADDRTLVVRLATRRPWFAAETANPTFSAVHRPTVERYGDRWTDPAHIVTNGPLRLTSVERGRRAVLERWAGWRDAGGVAIDRVVVLVQPDKDDRIRAFAQGDVDVVYLALPPHRFTDSRFYERYRLMAVSYLQLNASTIRDPRQRRAMALAVSRDSLTDQPPATRLVPAFEDGGTAFLTARPRLDEARALMEEVERPRRRITLWYDKSRAGARGLDYQALARAWGAIGIETSLRGLDAERFWATLDEPMPPGMDVRSQGWVADYPDPMAFLEPFTCRSSWNVVHFCDSDYDALVERALATTDAAARERLYRRLEGLLTGPNGAFPVIPTFGARAPFLESDRIRATFGYPLTPIGLDLASVRLDEASGG